MVDVLLPVGWVAALGHRGAPTVAGVVPETSLTLVEADRMLSALAAKGHLKVRSRPAGCSTPCGEAVLSCEGPSVLTHDRN